MKEEFGSGNAVHALTGFATQGRDGAQAVTVECTAAEDARKQTGELTNKSAFSVEHQPQAHSHPAHTQIISLMYPA